MNMEGDGTDCKGPTVIVFGNEKGGSGKSTTAVHVALALMEDGFRVACIDLDSRQSTLTRYLSNRAEFIKRTGQDLPLPNFQKLSQSAHLTREETESDERERFLGMLGTLSGEADILVIDCPGSDNYLSRLAHSYADTLISPMNDSFVDLDLFARFDATTLEVEGPSLYSEMVWEARKRRAMRDKGAIDWIVIRNRIQNLEARNMRAIRNALAKLGKRVGFRAVPGFGERVIYKEMFLKGLTLLDLKIPGILDDGRDLTLARVTARQELRQLVAQIDLPELPAKESQTRLRETA